MTLNQIKYFMAICDNGYSMSAAAEKMCVSQSAISLALKELENEFSIKLLERTTKHIKITNDGKKFYAYSKVVLDDIKDLEHQFKKITYNEKLNVGFSAKCQGIMTQFINSEEGQKYFSEYNIFFMSSSELITLVEDNKLDVAVITTSMLDKFPNFNIKKLAESAPVVYTNKISNLSQHDTLSPEDLEYEPMVVFMEYAASLNNAMDNYAYFTKNLNMKNIVGYTTSIGVVMSMLKKNTASVIIGAGSLQDDNLKMIPFRERTSFDISAIWKKDKKLDQTIISMFSCIEKLYQNGTI